MPAEPVVILVVASDIRVAQHHLIQDADPAKDNFGTISQHPERIDINYLTHSTNDWLHINAVAYNAEFDQVMCGQFILGEFTNR